MSGLTGLQLCILFCCTLQVSLMKTNAESIRNLLQELDEQRKFQMHLIIDMQNQNSSEQFLDFKSKMEIPRILIKRPDVVQQHLYIEFNMEILTIASLSMLNFNQTFDAMEKLLWRRHYTTILMILENEDFDLLNLFQRCWAQGYTSILVLHRQRYYTYTPFPTIQVKPLNHCLDFLKKSHFHNFHNYTFMVPFTQMPPIIFSYNNREGHLIRSGIYYKIVENFVNHYNGCMRHTFYDIWTSSLKPEDIVAMIIEQGLSFIPCYLAINEGYESSDSFHFSKVYLIVPAEKEIDQSLYLLVSFKRDMWLMVFLLLMVIYLLLVVVYYCKYQKLIYVEALLHTLKIIIFMYDEVFKDRTFFNLLLNFLFLTVGLFLTNSYVCNLSSMYTSRVYETDFKSLEDVERTQLGIHVYSTDYDGFMAVRNMPPVIYERMFVGNNSEFYANIQNLNLVNIYTAGEATVDFVLFQQLYVKRPWAKYIPEPIYTLPSSIKIPHRSPFIELFNRHLSYLKDSGILYKFKADSQWDGILSGTTQFFQDAEMNTAVSMAYLQNAFVMWLLGMLMAFIAFVGEFISVRKFKFI
uniref:Ionotropic glutamate receptor C-terminal domain-containing protein n=1 Tax=Stomoxys calcitrans TaxID=35570 RepID=A0A1I8PJJ6_STOCA